MREDAAAAEVVHAGPDPARIATPADLVRELELLRRRAAKGTQRARVSLERLTAATGIPRSTVHSYVHGDRLPTPDSLDQLVIALGATRPEQAQWAEALYRLSVPAAKPVKSATPELLRIAPRQLPAPPSGFVGRDEQLARLSELAGAALRDSDAPHAIVITGTAGVGKTALALRWAHTNSALFPDGQLWVDLFGFSGTQVLRPADVLERLLRALAVGTAELPDDPDARAALFRSTMANRRLLLVLDNARDSAQVRQLLPGASQVLTLITSRNQLRSLAAGGAARVAVNRLDSAAATVLLASGLPVDVDATLTSRLVEQCDGLPLALRITRERLSAADADEIESLADEFDLGRQERLAALDLNDSSDDVSVRGALESSYAALPPDAAALLRRLPLCLLTVSDLDCVSVVAASDLATSRRLLDVLVSANVVDRAGPHQYRLHDLVATFADERLRAEESPEEVRQARIRLLRHLISASDRVTEVCDPQPWTRAVSDPRNDAAESANCVPDGPAGAKAWMSAHVDLIAAAVRDACMNGLAELGWTLAEHGYRALYPIASVSRLEASLRVALRAAREHDAVTARIALQRILAIALARSGRLDEAEGEFVEAILVSEAAGDADSVVVCRANLAILWSWRGDLLAALEQLRAVVASDAGPPEKMPILLALTDFEWQRGDLDEFARRVEQVLAHPSVQSGEGLFFEQAQFLASRLDLLRGDSAAATDRLREAEAQARNAGRALTLCYCLLELARVRRETGDLTAAAAAARDALAVAVELGSRIGETSALAATADVLRMQGRSREALRLLGQALDRARESGLRYAECETLTLMAAAQLAGGERVLARRSAADALELAERCGYLRLRAAASAVLDGEGIALGDAG
jgi:tetratricopeptide (TPR) repeat protein